PDDAVAVARAFRQAGIDYVDVSSGGINAQSRPPETPGYNAPFAERIGREADITTRTVGLIVTPAQADEIVTQGRADMVALARAVLDDPHWGWHAAAALGAQVPRPPQYERATPKVWPGAQFVYKSFSSAGPAGT